MTFDPKDIKNGLIAAGSEHDTSPIAKVTNLLVANYRDGEVNGWDEVRTERWNTLCEVMGFLTFYTPDEVEEQIVLRAARKPPAAHKRRLVKGTRYTEAELEEVRALHQPATAPSAPKRKLRRKG